MLPSCALSVFVLQNLIQVDTEPITFTFTPTGTSRTGKLSQFRFEREPIEVDFRVPFLKWNREYWASEAARLKDELTITRDTTDIEKKIKVIVQENKKQKKVPKTNNMNAAALRKRAHLLG